MNRKTITKILFISILLTGCGNNKKTTQEETEAEDINDHKVLDSGYKKNYETPEAITEDFLKAIYIENNYAKAYKTTGETLKERFISNPRLELVRTNIININITKEAKISKIDIQIDFLRRQTKDIYVTYLVSGKKKNNKKFKDIVKLKVDMINGRWTITRVMSDNFRNYR